MNGKGLGVYWLVMVLAAGAVAEGKRVDFEDVSEEAPPLMIYDGPGGGGYYNGWDGSGGFGSEEIWFGNTFTDWGGGFTSWEGWSYSTMKDVETAGFTNQYSAYPGETMEGSVYAVGYSPTEIRLPAGWREIISVEVANTTYAALSMRDGDAFAKKFGDDPDTEPVESEYPDWFRLWIRGMGPGDEVLGEVAVYLADFRGEPGTDFISDEWIEVDLTGLDPEGKGVERLVFELTSSDTGTFGMNTPGYFAIDNLLLGNTPSWGSFHQRPDGWVRAENYLGWIFPSGDWVYIHSLGKWAYLPEEWVSESGGSWIYLPN